MGFRMDASTYDLDIGWLFRSSICFQIERRENVATLFHVAETMFIGPQLLSGCISYRDIHPRHESKRHFRQSHTFLSWRKMYGEGKKGSWFRF